MSEQPNTSAPEQSPAIHRPRLWWCCTYLLTIFAFFLFHYVATGFFYPLEWVQELPFATVIWAPLTPAGLGLAFSSIIMSIATHLLHLGSSSSDGTIESWREGIGLLMLPLAYAVFWAHWKLSIKATSRVAFVLLMLALIVLTSGSLVSCMQVPIMPTPGKAPPHSQTPLLPPHIESR